MKKLIALLLVVTMLCACANGSASSAPAADSSAGSSAAAEAEEETTELIDADGLVKDFFAKTDSVLTDTAFANGGFPQLSDPDADAPRVRISTTAGDITLVLYPEAAPLAVENFLTHCRNGYYDGSLFHRVIADFMIQSGIPKEGDGDSIFGGPFRNEQNDRLRHFTGALSMANAGPNTNTCQFFIVQGSAPVDEADLDTLMLNWYYNEINTRLYSYDFSASSDQEMEVLFEKLNELLPEAQENGLPAEVLARYQPAAEEYLQHGGSPLLDYGYTVFGQVTEGMDVVDAIATAETTTNASGEKSVPVDPVMIVSTEVL